MHLSMRYTIHKVIYSEEMKKKDYRSESMKEIIWVGILLILAGCGPAITPDITADPLPEGWYSQNKTDMQLSKDKGECHTLCQTA